MWETRTRYPAKTTAEILLGHVPFSSAARTVRRTVACVFITAVPITKLFAWGDGNHRGRGIVEDMCYERPHAEACVGVQWDPASAH
jgi:hypothetical protein